MTDEQAKSVMQMYVMQKARDAAEQTAIQEYADSRYPEGLLRNRIYDQLACTASQAIDYMPAPKSEPERSTFAWHDQFMSRVTSRLHSDPLFHRLVAGQSNLIWEEVQRYQRGIARATRHP